MSVRDTTLFRNVSIMLTEEEREMLAVDLQEVYAYIEMTGGNDQGFHHEWADIYSIPWIRLNTGRSLSYWSDLVEERRDFNRPLVNNNVFVVGDDESGECNCATCVSQREYDEDDESDYDDYDDDTDD